MLCNRTYELTQAADKEGS